MPAPPLLWLLLAAGLWLLVLLGLDSDGLLLVGGTAALALALLAAALPLPAGPQVAGFALLVLAGYGLVRRWAARSADAGALAPSPRTEQAAVISPFDADGRGRVQWQGQSWAAQNLEPTRPLAAGERVVVMGREGNCLQVLAQPRLPG
ncbi:MAG: NfeD family protein [Cyanobacteriota bacterium]|nr:NfeD family protein [Cyanobacteriota bacterium]